jgi:sigma-B regulation protein RsbU (phosphoserine phosphatase)
LLKKGGMVLGPSPVARYHRGFVELEPEDLIFLHSDGITDAESPEGEAFGFERLVACVRARRHLPPEEIVASVFEAVDGFMRGRSQTDDQTLLVIRRVAETAPRG